MNNYFNAYFNAFEFAHFEQRLEATLHAMRLIRMLQSDEPDTCDIADQFTLIAEALNYHVGDNLSGFLLGIPPEEDSDVPPATKTAEA